ncbi:hypothetical protein CASFOL_023052 [Castilleja foliolosa]|uniref:Uncharacterized protein n=1 Tax=Castilleja foliolosa TaxID=1961234 RepID=A0ABD3CJG7_9LAMI
MLGCCWLIDGEDKNEGEAFASPDDENANPVDGDGEVNVEAPNVGLCQLEPKTVLGGGALEEEAEELSVKLNTAEAPLLSELAAVLVTGAEPEELAEKPNNGAVLDPLVLVEQEDADPKPKLNDVLPGVVPLLLELTAAFPSVKLAPNLNTLDDGPLTALLKPKALLRFTACELEVEPEEMLLLILKAGNDDCVDVPSKQVPAPLPNRGLCSLFGTEKPTEEPPIPRVLVPELAVGNAETLESGLTELLPISVFVPRSAATETLVVDATETEVAGSTAPPNLKTRPAELDGFAVSPKMLPVLAAKVLVGTEFPLPVEEVNGRALLPIDI